MHWTGRRYSTIYIQSNYDSFRAFLIYTWRYDLGSLFGSSSINHLAQSIMKYIAQWISICRHIYDFVHGEFPPLGLSYFLIQLPPLLREQAQCHHVVSPWPKFSAPRVRGRSKRCQLATPFTTSEVNDYVKSLSRGCYGFMLEGNRFSSMKVSVKIIYTWSIYQESSDKMILYAEDIDG